MRRRAAGGRMMQRVLIVDDEPEILLALQAALERGLRGTEVVLAASPEEALATLAATRIDAVLTDFRMPGMSGLELLERIRRAAPSVSAVMMTAYAEDRVVIEAINRVGVVHFLLKPFAVAEVVRVMGEVLARRREQEAQVLRTARALRLARP